MGNFMIGLGGVLLLGSAAVKLAQVPKVTEMFGALGFGGNRLTFIAMLEIISAILFLIPTTRAFGLLMVSAYMGGAISAHLGHGQMITQPSAFLFVLWLGAWLRHPEILWSLNRTSSTSRFAQQRNSETMLRQV